MIEGLGLGLRFKYLDDLKQQPLPIKWLELLADQFHDLDAPIIKKIDQLLAHFPCVLHSVNLSIAGEDALDQTYLDFLAKLVESFQPEWVSDHLCFSKVGNTYFHELLPIPFTAKLLDQVAFKIDAVQTLLKRPFLIENISSYLRLKSSEMSEATFIAKLTEKTGCGILLDVNNIVVTCHNHQESISEFIETIPFDKVRQLHMAGAIEQNQLLVDTHSRPLAEDVLALYRHIIAQHGPIPTCLEWDNDLPDFTVVVGELEKIMNHEAAFLKALEGDAADLARLNASPEFEKRWAIYETSIIGTRQKTLLKIFKPLEQLIGLEAFHELCYRYAKSHASHEANLNRYGQGLSQFAKDAPFAKDLPYLSDFIEFCYIWQQVYLQGGEPILLESDYPAYAIWERCQPEFKGDQHLENWQGPFQYVLYREQDKVRVMAVPAIASHNQQDQADGA